MESPTISVTPQANWAAIRALGVDSPFECLDQWMINETLDVEAVALLRGVRLNQAGWAEAPIVLWRMVLLADIVGLDTNALLKSVADSLSLRCFTRLGFEQAPPTKVLFNSFVRQKQGELKEAVDFIARSWTHSMHAKRARGRRHTWKELLDDWTRRLAREPDRPLRVLQN